MAIRTSFFGFILIAFLISSPFANCQRSSTKGEEDEVEVEKPFTYEEKDEILGPKNWGGLKPEWKNCGKGKLQSPIDLVSEKVQVLKSLKSLKPQYKPTLANITNRGHDIAVHWEGHAGGITINGTLYELAQIHWHSPSEHRINGTRYDLEGHLVHKSANSGIAVISVLYKIGQPDSFLSKVLRKTKTITEEGSDVGVLNPREVRFARKKYYRYIGSLTTPPCTEGVIWTVIKKVKTVSARQVNALKEAVHDGYEENARPVQDLHGRTIYSSTSS